MTKSETEKCKKLMQEALIAKERSDREYKKAEKHLKDGNELEWEIAQRNADQGYGYAQGINQALSVLNFEHPEMKNLL